MGRRGPQPRSAEEHWHYGTYRRDRHANVERRPELLPEPGMRVPPEWLDEESRLVWWDVSLRLSRSGALALSDYYALTVYCETWGRWRKATAFLKMHGDSYLVKDRVGNVKGVRLYPQVKLANALADQLARLGSQLGLSPMSRGRSAAIPDWVYDAKEDVNSKLSELERGRVKDPLFQAEGNGGPEPEPPAAESATDSTAASD